MADSSGGIGLCGLMFLIFMTLKLCGVIDWSWWWVTSPLWAPTGLVAVVAVAIGVVLGVRALFRPSSPSRGRRGRWKVRIGR